MALQRFIDDIAVEVIEAKLMNTLEKILSPVSVHNMSADRAACIAGEPEYSKMERLQLTKQLNVLKSGLETCRRFVGLHAQVFPGSVSLPPIPTHDITPEAEPEQDTPTSEQE